MKLFRGWTSRWATYYDTYSCISKLSRSLHALAEQLLRAKIEVRDIV